jgi:hypothetical protein
MSGRVPAGLFVLGVQAPGQADQTVAMDRMPFVVGRGLGSSLSVEAPGVWERHLTFDLVRGEGLVVSVGPGAVAYVEGRTFDRHRVRNGDEMKAGTLRIRVSVGPPRRKRMTMGDWMVWGMLVGVFAVQMVVVWWMLQ